MTNLETGMTCSRLLPNAFVILTILTAAASAPSQAYAGQGDNSVTETQVQEAVDGIAQAKGYNQLVTALGQHRSVLGSVRAQTLVDERLRSAAGDDVGRRLLLILGQLFTDTSKEGAETAANRYLVRLIAMGAMTTGDSDQLQRLLMRYYEFSPNFTPALIKPSLAVPAIDWPPALPELMTLFVEDWHRMGANEAARSFADALHAAIDDPTGELARSRDQALTGQWYATQRGISGELEETNLILTKSGVARIWVTTGGPEDIEGIEAGRWATVGGALIIKWDDGQTTSGPYQLSGGQLQWSALGIRIWMRR